MAALAVLMVAAAGVILPQTAAHAAPVGQIVVAPLGSTTQAMPAEFQFNVSWSCSGSPALGETCENLRITVPVTLDNPAGAVEDMDLWTTAVNLPSPSAAGFTTSWTRSGTQLLLELTATQPVSAGVTENLGVVIRPHHATGDGVGFTFGRAELTSTSFASVTSADAIAATITAQRLLEVEKQLISLRPDGAGAVRAIYRIWPRIRQAWDPATEAWGACGTNVTGANAWDTALAGTVVLVDQLPAEATFVSANGGGVYDASAHTVTWNDCAQIGGTLLVEVDYPGAATAADLGYIANLTNSVTRTFTDTSGMVRTSSDDVAHANIGLPRSLPPISKCGTSTMIPDPGIAAPGGSCAPLRVSPVYDYSGDRNTHSYLIRVAATLEGDEITVTDWMPCFTNPVAAASVETYASAVSCTDTTSAITGLGFQQANALGSTRPLLYEELVLHLADGSSRTFDTSNPIASLNPLPVFSGGAVVGFTVRLRALDPDQVTGLVGVTGSVLPGVDRDMVLENTATVSILNQLLGDDFAARDTVGRVRVVDGPFGATQASGGVFSGRQYVRGNFGASSFDPAVSLPTYTIVLPEGYEVVSNASGDPDIVISGLGLPDSANPALADPANYTVEVVPEDLASGTPALLRVTPRADRPVVPTDGHGRWPQIAVSAFVRPTWGVAAGILPIATYTSASTGASGPHIRGCIWNNSWFAPQQLLDGDAADYDGDLETAGDTGCISRANADFITSSVAASQTSKMVRHAGTSDPWTTAGGALASETGAVEYQIRWENAGRPALQDIVLYDVFPYVGDTGVLAANSSAPRGSEFAPVFVGVTGQSTTSNVQIQFSASSDPCRPEIHPGQGACVNDWTADAADLGGASEVRAVRIVLSGQWAGGSSFSLRYAMQAPVGTPAGSTAWNTVAQLAHLNGGAALASAESAGVGVRMLPAPTVSIDKYAAAVTEGSTILAGTDVTWTYSVRNTSTERLEQLVVTDSRGVAVTCPQTALDAGASMECTGTGNVGTVTPYANTGVVTGRGAVTGAAVTASDPWSVRLTMPTPGVTIVKDSAAVAEDSTVAAETSATWRYTVSNAGEERLLHVAVVDDRGVIVTCPQSTLEVGATMVCTGTGSVGFGPSYTNVGTVSAVGGVSAIPVTADDPWTVNVTPYSTGITIDKVAPAVTEGSRVRPSTVVNWEYIVTNTGQEPIDGISVTDDRGVIVTCPATELAPGESMTCTGSGSVGAGPDYRNLGTVTGTTTLTNTSVSDDDPWQVEVREPVASIGLVKGALNAVRGDRVPANFVVDWRYTVVNTGEEAIESLSVVDDQGVVVACPVSRLEVGETVVCAGAGSIGAAAQYTNVATATGRGALTGNPVDAMDTWTVGVDIPPAAIRIIKDAVGHSAGDPVRPGAVFTWTYTVVNTGGQPIADLRVVDDRGVEVVCPESGLEIGDSMVCTGSGGVGSAESYTNIGSVTGTPLWAGPPVVDEDPWSTPITPAPTSTPGPTPGGPPPSLPVTGAGPLAPFAVASALLILAGTALLLRGRRRNRRPAGL